MTQKFLWSSLVCLALIFAARPASAHEKRAVAKKQWVVGFLKEPAFSGEMNGIDLRVADKKGKPVAGLEQTLKAEVGYGDSDVVMEMPLRPRYNQPGAYAAYFLPARAGDYRFRIYGMVQGKAVDETFRSGAGFSGVENGKALSFPNVRFESSAG